MLKEAKFILDKPKGEILTMIFLIFSCKDGRLKYYTKEKILPEDWNFPEQRAFKNKKLNDELSRLSRITDKFIESCRIMVKPVFKEELRRELDSKSDREVKVKANGFFESWQSIMDKATSGELVIPKSKRRYTAGSLKNWKKVKGILLEFDPNMEFDTITLDTYTAFIQFCNRKDWAANYTGSLVKCWKTIMTISHTLKWHNNIIYKHPEFRGIQEVAEKVYLNEQEIKLIYELDLTGRGMREVIRDRYIINLYTGLRISDMITLSTENIHNGMITHINQKTSKKVVIPVHPYVVEIIEKYGGKMPKQYSEVVVNRYIKLIAKDAELTEKIRYTRTQGGVVKKFTAEKWELITNHTSRRSMATNMLKFVNVLEAMPVMGMSLKTLQIYNKISAEENAETLKENKFFNK